MIDINETRVKSKGILRQTLESKGKGTNDIPPPHTGIIYGNISRHPATVPDLNVADFTASHLASLQNN